MRVDIVDAIYSMLAEVRPEFDFRESDNFVQDGMLDSFDVITLVSMIEERFGIKIDALDILPENFSGVKPIANLVTKNGGVV